MDNRKNSRKSTKKKKSPMGVFQIENAVTGRRLIDNSTDMPSKWNRHKMELNWGTHQNKPLLKDWREYGEEKFVFEILSVLKESDQEKVNYRKELKLLQEMVLEDIGDGDFY